MNVIFFDGYCGLCNGFINFIMKIDKKNRFQFSPLQSEYAKKNLPEEFISDLKTVVVQIDHQSYKKSQAVLQIFKKLGMPWSILFFLKFIPSIILNKAYDLIATNRYKLFGKNDTCRLPTPAERQKFIM